MPRVPRYLQETSDSDDESDEESSVGIIDAAVSHVRCEVLSSTRKKNKKHVNEDGEEWKTSKQKEDIVAAFLDNESGIQIRTQTVLDGRSRIQWQTFEG